MEIKATGRQRYNFAVQHMIAAARFARLCYKVEDENAGAPFGPFYDEIVSYVMATILSSVASLEANINEIFADLRDGFIVFDGLDMNLVTELWDLIEKKPILEKYQFALVLKKKDRMKKGDKKYQSVDTLIKVRNALVHFKPEWLDEQQEHKAIGKLLRGKFPLSPFFNKNDPIFPMRCMTHGFADWAVRSSLEFTKCFTQIADLPNRFAQFLDRMDTKPKKLPPIYQ
jgi:hypothetical protein